MSSDFQKLGRPVLGHSEYFFPDSFHPWQCVIACNIQILPQKCKADPGQKLSHGVEMTEFDLFIRIAVTLTLPLFFGTILKNFCRHR